MMAASRQEQGEGTPRPKRADAQRKKAALVKAALEVFTESGVDAPVREIAQRAGVGLGTVYRHFPQRSDLIVAVYRSQVDECADAAAVLAGRHEPFEALAGWMRCFADFISTKRGLARGLNSSDPAYSALPGYFFSRLGPALQMLLDAAIDSGAIRRGYQANELLQAVAALGRGGHDKEPGHLHKMVELLVDGLRRVHASAEPGAPKEGATPPAS
ncbi:TetR/AcrR family transcriptional regulator [Halotalea alkalilenta]|uniref:TetR/AcrR family transcriptional regulator n=1 Tax=Halotalea alkalilenta TaxID=376489 RepID=UPI0006932D0B|nr:TetR/AcrR family transcriptional regulator [Halotalea alkalilenta]